MAAIHDAADRVTPETHLHPGPVSRGALVSAVISVTVFVALHIAAVSVIWVGVSWAGVVLFAISYSTRCWAIAGGFHRYFAHHGYQTSRWLQFIIGFVGTAAMQLGVLSWVSTHRRHHRHADDPCDPHSPHHQPLWYSHVGWVFDPRLQRLEPRSVRDLMKYPELVWLERYKVLPVVVLAGGMWLGFGTTGVVWGFVLPTVVLWHASLATGSIAHLASGYRNFDLDDDSRNNRGIAIALLGGGWHNNHHRAPRSAQHSTGRHEPDPIFAGIRVLERLGLVWNVNRSMPAPERG